MKALQEDIKTENFKHVYLLCGEEAYLQHQYKEKLQKALVSEGDTMNFTLFQGKDINTKEVIDLAETLPFFAERRVIFLEDSGLCKKNDDAISDYMDSIPDTTYLVFVESEVDKRNRLYKQIKKVGRVVEFERQTESVLISWILGRLKKEGKNITKPVMDLFLEKTGDNMELISHELEKLLCYTMEKDVIEADDVESICTHQVNSRIFDMVDAIGNRDQKLALDLYYDLLTLKEQPMRILFLITRQFHILMQLKDMSEKGFDYDYMAGKAGVPKFAVRKYMGQARKFKYSQLKQAVRDGGQAEEDVKTGKIADRLAVELLLVKYSS